MTIVSSYRFSLFNFRGNISTAELLKSIKEKKIRTEKLKKQMKRNRKLALGCSTVCAEQGNVGRKEREKLRKKKNKGHVYE